MTPTQHALMKLRS